MNKTKKSEGSENDLVEILDFSPLPKKRGEGFEAAVGDFVTASAATAHICMPKSRRSCQNFMNTNLTDFSTPSVATKIK